MKKGNILSRINWMSPYTWIGILVILMALIYVLRKIGLSTISRKGKGDKSGEKRWWDDITTEENTLQNLGMKPSYHESWYEKTADYIHEALRFPIGVGDDDDGVKNIMMRLNNDLDVAKLEKAFGKRCEYLALLVRIPICSDELDLFGYLRADLAQWRIKQINENWKEKGITSRL